MVLGEWMEMMEMMACREGWWLKFEAVNSE